MNILVTGGSGSGKSVWAEKQLGALPAPKKIYIATMKVYDEESVRRVERHRAQRRDLDMETVECEKNLGSLRIAEGSALLLEDIPNLLANEMFDGGRPEAIVKDISQLLRGCAHAVIVTNDVFADGLRYAEGTDAYMRALARINAELAALCDLVVEVVYSIPVPIKGELPCV